MKTDGRLASEWNPPHRDCIFWGKFVHEGPRCLPLVTHSLDVALVFRRLCTLNAVRRSLEHTTASELTDQVLDRLAVMAMFHDVGKANLGFQFKVFDKSTKQAGHIRELAPILDQAVYDEELRYAFIQALPPELPSWFCDGEAATSYLMAIFSHHGKPLQFRGETTGSYGHAKGWWQPRDGWEPMSAIREIAESARTVFPAAFAPGGPPLPPEPRFHHRFAGLVIAADWLGSHGYWFPVDRVGFTERLQHDRRVIPKLLQAVGLDVMPLRELLQMRTGEGWDCFERRFDLSPRPLQQAIDTLDPDDSRARLVIAESETGSGKTEAALNWFIKLFVAGKVDGLYFALPTRVAARELYTRIDCTINDWFPDSDNRPVTLLAVPGYAQVNGIAPERILPDSEAANRWQDDNVTRLRERQWAAERPKRFLAATVAVGTIDQALLSIVQTSHAHLRSVFLDRSLLVVDEVHASDTYASQLLQSLLEHHLGVGGYAMLLSATLGSQARNTYVSVSGGRRSLATSGTPAPDLDMAISTPYPALTLADGISRPTKTATAQSKSVQFEILPVAFNPEAITNILVDALDQEARVLVVLNTVGRANAFLRRLEAVPTLQPSYFFNMNDVVCPHHGRFAPEDRNLLDRRVSERLGKGSLPGPLLLVGTQTLEQSLDIDSDLLVTDLAPADVLLQRVGRLHRHDRSRPRGFEKPRCLVLVPDTDLESALNEHGDVASAYKRLGYGSVYEDLGVLELTCQALGTHGEVVIPRDNRLLVEMATHPECLDALVGKRWEQHRQRFEGGELAKVVTASLATAIYDQYFGESSFNEFGGPVAVRLGANSLELELSSPVMGPFGETIHRLVIPGHMAPCHQDDEITVIDESDGTIHLRCGDCYYKYSRYGLEVEE